MFNFACSIARLSTASLLCIDKESLIISIIGPKRFVFYLTIWLFGAIFKLCRSSLGTRMLRNDLYSDE